GRTCAHAASKLRQLLDGGVAIRYRLRLDAPEHEVAPRLRAVFRAPHRFRLPHRFWLDDRVGKDVHGDVVELGEIFLQALAVRAVRVGQDRDLAPAAAAYRGDRPLQRQALPLHRGELALALLGQVA